MGRHAYRSCSCYTIDMCVCHVRVSMYIRPNVSDRRSMACSKRMHYRLLGIPHYSFSPAARIQDFVIQFGKYHQCTRPFQKTSLRDDMLYWLDFPTHCFALLPSSPHPSLSFLASQRITRTCFPGSSSRIAVPLSHVTKHDWQEKQDTCGWRMVDG